MLTIVTPARTIALTTLARVKSELKLTTVDAARDAWLADQVEEASRAIAEELDRPITRHRVAERFDGMDRTTALLALTPLAVLESVTHETRGAEDLTTGECRIAEAESGLIWRDGGWGDDAPWRIEITVDRVPQMGRQPWTAQYLGGWLTWADDIQASGVGVVAADKSFTLIAGVMPLLGPGDVIDTRGFAQAENNGRFLVNEADDTGVTVTGTLADEAAAPAAATIRVHTLPAQLERFAIDAVKAWYFGRLRDPSITREQLGDWAASYSGGAALSSEANSGKATALPRHVINGLDRWRRLM